MPQFPFTYIPETLAFGDKPIWVSATDGDTPTIQLPVRMLGIDAPELHYQGATEKNPGKYDATLSSFLQKAGKTLPTELRKHLAPRLMGKTSTRQIARSRVLVRPRAHVRFEIEFLCRREQSCKQINVCSAEPRTD